MHWQTKWDEISRAENKWRNHNKGHQRTINYQSKEIQKKGRQESKPKERKKKLNIINYVEGKRSTNWTNEDEGKGKKKLKHATLFYNKKTQCSAQFDSATQQKNLWQLRREEQRILWWQKSTQKSRRYTGMLLVFSPSSSSSSSSFSILK